MGDNKIFKARPTGASKIIISLERRTVQLVGFALAVAIALYLVNHNPLTAGKPNPGTTTFPSAIAVKPFGPQEVTEAELRSQAKTFGLPTYWAKTIPNTKMELTVTSVGGFYVRYLPPDAKIGTKTEYFTVGTTYDSEAYAKVQSLTKQAGAKWSNYATGALAASASPTDQNIYFAYLNYPILIDVFSKDPQSAWDMIQAGTVDLLEQPAK